MSVLRFENVSKQYPGGHAALEDVSFEVAEGEAAAPLAPAAAVPRPEAAALPEGERKPRKRRRRRHGRPLEGAEGAVANVAPAAPKPVAAPKRADDNAGFLTRLGRKIRALVSGS